MEGVAGARAPLGAVGTLMLGWFGLIAPMRAARMVGLVPDGSRGISELRATYGGLFIAMGLAAWYFKTPQPTAWPPSPGGARPSDARSRWRWTDMCLGSTRAASRWKPFWAPCSGQAIERSAR